MPGEATASATSFEELAKNVRSIQDIIERVSAILKDAGKSANIEVVNTTSVRLQTRINGDGHAHGGFAGANPGQDIAPVSRDAFGSRSAANSVGTGTAGSVFYLLDEEGTTWHVRWELPFLGENEAQCSVSGPHADWYETTARYTGGDKNVKIAFYLAEKAMRRSDMRHSDWRACGVCKALVWSLDGGMCPGRVHHPDRPVIVSDFSFTNPRAGEIKVTNDDATYLPHQPAGDPFVVGHSIPGPAREGAWRRCGRCKAIFFDGWDTKGACPNWEGRRGHVAVDGGPEYMLRANVPAGMTQQRDWRFCTKCYVLFYLPHNGGSACAAGGQHHAHEADYILDRVQP